MVGWSNVLKRLRSDLPWLIVVLILVIVLVDTQHKALAFQEQCNTFYHDRFIELGCELPGSWDPVIPEYWDSINISGGELYEGEDTYNNSPG